MKAEVKLRDVCVNGSLNSLPVVKCTMESADNNKSLIISFSGFGDYADKNGNGAPILIEIRNGVPTILIWDNINQDTHKVISLEGAREKDRVKAVKE